LADETKKPPPTPASRKRDDGSEQQKKHEDARVPNAHDDLRRPEPTTARMERRPPSKPAKQPAPARSLPAGVIRIKLKAYDVASIEQAGNEIVATIRRTGATVKGPVRLPTKRNIYTVIKSPFKDKDSQEAFEIRTHIRLIDIHDARPDTIAALQRLDHLPAGVNIDIEAG
jgi:small subunit ribosomal protein S10